MPEAGRPRRRGMTAEPTPTRVRPAAREAQVIPSTAGSRLPLACLDETSGGLQTDAAFLRGCWTTRRSLRRLRHFVLADRLGERAGLTTRSACSGRRLLPSPPDRPRRPRPNGPLAATSPGVARPPEALVTDFEAIVASSRLDSEAAARVGLGTPRARALVGRWLAAVVFEGGARWVGPCARRIRSSSVRALAGAGRAETATQSRAGPSTSSDPARLIVAVSVAPATR